MVHSLLVISLGVGGIGLASSFEELYFCRLLTGAGVSLLRYVVHSYTWSKDMYCCSSHTDAFICIP